MTASLLDIQLWSTNRIMPNDVWLEWSLTEAEESLPGRPVQLVAKHIQAT